jgi:DNA replication protein DnaC
VSDPDYDLPEIGKGYSSLRFFVENLDVVLNKGLGLYMYSKERGRGKTTLAHYIAYKVVESTRPLDKYIRSLDFGFDHVEDFCKDDNYKWKNSVYVLDDLGNEDRSAPWKKAEFLSNLQKCLHYRRDRGLVTLITSNYAPRDLSNLYEGVVDSLLEINPDGNIGGVVFRQVEVIGGEDLRTVQEFSRWPDLEQEN